ncbi:MAG: DUF2281 domain-containing protein [Lewinellaceae bacterium]|nr:DUF2281 domain-containing protein [Lewinellaceae bacterium]
MTNKSIITQLQVLPENLKKEVLDFIGYLVMKYSKEQQKKPTPKFGSARGKYILAADFDEPLEDFKEYHAIRNQ